MDSAHTFRRAVRARRASRWLALALSVALPSTILDAALWESPLWGLTGELEGRIGYDTNIVARNDNIEDGFALARPEVTLARRASSTRLEFSGALEGTTFFEQDGFGSIDPSLHVLMRHPVAPDVEPAHEFDASWSRSTTANTDLGRRVRSDNRRLEWSSVLRDSGRTVIGAGAHVLSTDFKDVDLNTNEALELEVTGGYRVNPEVQLGAGYGHEWARSVGHAGRDDVRSSQDKITLRARGRLLPNVVGTVNAGAAFISYRGALVRNATEMVGGVSLEWRPDALTTATIGAHRFADFAPEGETALRTGLDVAVLRQIGGAFRFEAGGGVSRLERGFAEETDDAIATTLRAGLGYQLTERFHWGLEHRWTRQYADLPQFDYVRNLSVVYATVRL